MVKLLMISGDRALAQGKSGAFYNTLEEFHKYWERIDIICPRAKIQNSKFKTQNYNSKFKIFENVYIHPSPWPLVFQPRWILKKGKQIYREQKFNLMIVHDYPPFYNGIGARLLWNKIKVSYILEIFHIPGYPKAANLKEKIYRRIFYSFIEYDCRKAKGVRVMNDQVAEKLVALGVPESKIKSIPAVYIDFDVFRPMNLEKKYDLIFVGRLVKNKGIDLLIEAVRQLTTYNLQLITLIVGEGPMKESLKLKVKSLKLEDNIFFYGWAKDSQEIAKLLNQSKILVMPSYNEGGPRVVAEAMACGVPILATPVGIVSDVIKDGQSGRIIDWNIKDIAGKAKSLLGNTLEYEKYKQTGIEISRQFEKKAAIENYALKLQNLIS